MSKSIFGITTISKHISLLLSLRFKSTGTIEHRFEKEQIIHYYIILLYYKQI